MSSARAAARKIGVEEELMLVDGTGQVTAVGRSAVLAQAATEEPGVEPELFLQQLETATSPCTGADELAAALRRGRRVVGEAAAAAGARAVAMPTPVLPDPEERVTPKTRYHRIHDDYGELAREALVCAMHVHVEVDSDDEAVGVVDRIRPWLPMLVALSANSPFWRGTDTGHASWRSHLWGRWPTAGPADPYGDPQGYRTATERLMEWGAALDPGMLYFDIRLAERFPTVEIRVADVCTEAEDAVLVALLARALVATAAHEWCAAEPLPGWRTDLLRAAGWRAARHGISGPLVHPVTGVLVPVREAFDALLAHAGRALERAGDADRVRDGFERLVARGNGAVRQRAVHEATGDLARVVADLAERTERSWA
jgi:carboxylate-amine ligase